MEARGQDQSPRPSLVSRSIRNSFRTFRTRLGSSSKDTLGSASPTSTDVLRSPMMLSKDDSSSIEDDKHTSLTQLPKEVPLSPIQLDTVQKEIPVTPEPSTGSLKDFLGRLRSDSQRKRDSNGSASKSRNSSRLHRRRRVVQVDEAEKVNLKSRLKATLHAIEKSLHFTERDLETQLEDHDYVLEKAASDFLERTGLRQLEPNSTLKKFNLQDDTPEIHNAWSPCDPSVFNVRSGPQYKKTRTKMAANSQPIYEMVAVDMYSSEEKVEHLSRFMKIGELERDEGTHPLPSLFIVNFMLPLTEPRLFGGEANGPTVSFHFIMKLSTWAKQNPDHPAVQLTSRFINESGPNGSMRERLKIIVQVANPDEMDLGKVERGLCRQYNGLPFLYRTYNSKYHRGAGWFQADFDGHKSGYATRLARHSLLGWSNKIVANMAVLVESETDEEMPERVLGCANVHRLDCKRASQFVKPVATPLSPRAARRHKASSVFSDDGTDTHDDRKDSLLSENEDEYRDALAD